jgi:hypothetical protein
MPTCKTFNLIILAIRKYKTKIISALRYLPRFGNMEVTHQKQNMDRFPIKQKLSNESTN